MSEELDFFRSYLMEAPGDDDIPPDEQQLTNVNDMDTTAGDEPPAMNDDTPTDDIGGDDLGGDEPPDLGFGDDDDSFTSDDEGGESQPGGLDDKISSIMNVNLYQKFLTLVSDINAQVNNIKSNTDILFALNADSLNIVKPLEKLDENVRLYLKNSFSNERFEKNTLFYNKCVNLFNLLSQKFDAEISKGIKDVK